MIQFDSFRAFHQQNLQLFGICIPGTIDPTEDLYGHLYFRPTKLKLTSMTTEIDSVPIRLPIVKEQDTPYKFHSGDLYYKNEIINFKDTKIFIINWPEVENIWHHKGYTLPFEGTKNPYRELRLNPNYSGFCPGKCLFCHRRPFSGRIPNNKLRTMSVSTLIKQISDNEGENIFKQINQIEFITELFGGEDKFIKCVTEIREEINKKGFSENQSFGCSAQDIRTINGQRFLLDLVNPKRYSFTLEIFQNRQIIMGNYKGLPLDQVYRILENARKVGFKEIQINYLAGLDTLEECFRGFQKLSMLGLIDSIGLSTFTFFSLEQKLLRHKTAWNPLYYLELINILNENNIRIYNPESYDMGSPYTVLMKYI